MDKGYLEYVKLLKSLRIFFSVFRYIVLFLSVAFVIFNIIFYSGILDILFKIAISIVLNLLYFFVSRIITRKLFTNTEANIDEGYKKG